jgi:polysaccharide pyruvyl transferase WcaK-like protein
VKRSQVVLLGWYGSDNTGDEALLQAVVGALRGRGINNLHALSINPSETSKQFGLSSSKRSLLDPETRRALRGAGALVLGGGGLIQDRTSVYNLPLYAAFVAAARLMGLKVIGWGLGVEPLDTLLGKLLARFIINSSAHFSVRDAGSKGLLVQAGVPAEKVRVAADPAFLIDAGCEDQERPKGESLVVFCLRDLPDNRPGLNMHYVLPISVRRRLGLLGKGDTGRSAEFAGAVARGAKVVVQELGARVEFVQLWPGRDDTMARLVQNRAIEMGVDPGWMEIAAGLSTPNDVAKEVCRADLLVSMRLHALIFGSGCGVPGLALAYARKIRGFMRRIGSEQWVVEVETANPPPGEIEMKIRALWETRDRQREIVKAGAATARQKAKEDADTIAALVNGR